MKQASSDERKIPGDASALWSPKSTYAVTLNKGGDLFQVLRMATITDSKTGHGFVGFALDTIAAAGAVR
jgi:hypothetical protein